MIDINMLQAKCKRKSLFLIVWLDKHVKWNIYLDKPNKIKILRLNRLYNIEQKKKKKKKWQRKIYI